ncbi:hypothetical protein HC928_02780 [bacterium]|nr:hypothetical protein [bacterium]
MTTTAPHGYSTGLFVRLSFPQNFGMQQVANQVYEITVEADHTFLIPVDSSNFDVFSTSGRLQVPQVIPVGSDALGVLEALKNNGTILPET